MATPKGKVSKARKNSRRSAHWKLSMPGIVKCPRCGEWVDIFVHMGGRPGQTGTLASDERCPCGYVLKAGTYETDYASE